MKRRAPKMKQLKVGNVQRLCWSLSQCVCLALLDVLSIVLAAPAASLCHACYVALQIPCPEMFVMPQK